MRKISRKKVYPASVFVGMSGGVDSSVAVYLLKKQGYDVVGVFMKCWTESSSRINADFNADRRRKEECGWEREAEDARRVAEKLNIPFYVWDFEEEYKKKVVDYMVNGYRKGITPNPDVMCNKEIKFGLFFEKAMEMGADFVSTGHYVRIQHTTYNEQQTTKTKNKKLSVVGSKLLVAIDSAKDQSYFLWTLTQKQLAKCLFPIGDYLKPEVRKIAKKAGLPTAGKKDSQGICFLGQVSMDDFLKDYIPEKKGDILLDGKKIGRHKGAHFYTIGQRRIGANFQFPIPNFQKDRKPYYVAEKDVKKNIIKVVEGDKHPDLYKKEVKLTNVNFINPELRIRDKGLKLPVLARVRYRQPLVKAILSCELSVVSCKLIFEQAQKFVAPGQSAVWYDSKGQMLGGGIIK